jgi:hypothetical protein
MNGWSNEDAIKGTRPPACILHMDGIWVKNLGEMAS